MKKIRITAFVIALVLVLPLVLSACNHPHEHMYGQWTEVTAPTCTHAGVEQRVCRNDETHLQSRPIAALGHSYGEWVEITAATETEVGLQRATCTHSGCTHYIEEEIPKISSSQPQPIVVPTPPTIPADLTDEGVLIIGGYGRFVSELKVYLIAKDFEAYCNENGISRVFIGWKYTTATSNDELYDAVMEGQTLTIDVLLGGGNNIGTDLSNKRVQKSQSVTIFVDGANNTSRYHYTFNSKSITEAYFTYINSDRAVAILTAEE